MEESSSKKLARTAKVTAQIPIEGKENDQASDLKALDDQHEILK